MTYTPLIKYQIITMANNSSLSTDVVNNVTAISTEATDEFSIFRIYGILQLPIVIIGTVGSVIMLILLVKEKGKKTSCTVYVGAIVVHDIVLQILFVVSVLLNSAFNYNIYSTTNRFTCKFLDFIQLSLFLLSGWLVLTLTTEQLINAYFPRMKKLFKRRMPGIITVICLVCAVCYANLHNVVQKDVIPKQMLHDGTMVYECVNMMNYYNFLQVYQLYITPIISGILPGLIIIIENIFLIKTLCLSIATKSSERRQGYNVNRDMLVFTILISVHFLLMEASCNVLWIFREKYDVVLLYVIQTLLLMNHSFRLFVYILCKGNIRKRCIFYLRLKPHFQEHVNIDMEN